jgi:hypothetical protein
MTCITLDFIKTIFIWIVILGALVSLVNLLLPLVLGPLGTAGSTIIAALRIIVWAIVAIFVIVIVFDLMGCLLGVAGGFHLR